MNDADNPYHAPGVDVAPVDPDAATYQPRLWALSGRIGCVRALAYGLFFLLLINGYMMVVGLLRQRQLITDDGFGVAFKAAYVPNVLAILILARRRFNDIGRSGWWSLCLLIPVIKLLFIAALLCYPGDEGRNRFGPAPGKNSRRLWLALAALVLLAAGAKYAQYEQRSRLSADAPAVTTGRFP